MIQFNDKLKAVALTLFQYCKDLGLVKTKAEFKADVKSLL